MKTSGTILPSSRWLAKSMLKGIDFNTAKVIVELGPGNGVITHHILKRLNKDAHLVSFEINDAFYEHLLTIDNKQLTVLKTSAELIQEELTKLGFDKADHIVSSLPLTIIPKEISNTILKNSYNALRVNGMFIQFQYSLTYYKRLKAVFKENIKLGFQLLNIPPSFIYRCYKK